MKIHSKIHSFNADTFTPVQLYLQIRHHYRNCCLLESNDYHSRQDSRSFIGFEPLVSLEMNSQEFQIKTNGDLQSIPIQLSESLSTQVQNILNQYEFEKEEYNGFFGRMSFEFALPDETHISLQTVDTEIPFLHFFLFRYILIIDHFTNDGYLLENSLDGTFNNLNIADLLRLSAPSSLPFEVIGKETATFSDQAFSDLVKKGISHCKRGDVFQIVLSNRFEQAFFGDDFHIYRQLRRTNPSPYLFYFDFESYRLFGSSPEAQLVIQNGKAEIHPIAGTVLKTGDEKTDSEQLEFLRSDEKENAEHTMLVDLARNDLSRNCSNIQIEAYKEIQHFSHVIHLVSKVTGDLQSSESFRTVAQSFPAGTLSGTPKPKALELIHHYEKKSRSFYGGAIGILQPNGNTNMAIVIRSILSKENTLNYQAGAGVVLDSQPEKETKEVHHKLRAVREAIRKAHQFQSQTENNNA